MMDFDAPELASEFKEAFGRETNTLSVRELWWLIKFAKHVRGRCRSNAALLNYLNRNFTHAQFREVLVTGLTGTDYKSMKVSIGEQNHIEGEADET